MREGGRKENQGKIREKRKQERERMKEGKKRSRLKGG